MVRPSAFNEACSEKSRPVSLSGVVMASKPSAGRIPGWRRPLRWLLAALLTPPAIGVSWAVRDVILTSGRALDFWVAVGSGVGVWLVVFFSLPRPMWLYVVGHELTHALWALLFGGRVKAFKATRHGGHVVLTKTNSLIALAPYFFPIYAVLWALVFLGSAWFFAWRRHAFWFHFGLGLTYAFHLTLTATVLRTRQPDLAGEGWVFSGVLIWLVHAGVLLLALPMLAGNVAPATALAWAGDRTSRVILSLVRWLGGLG